MTGLKNKNGALQRDKLKMGIGKNERMMGAQRDSGSDRMLTMHRERYGKIGGEKDGDQRRRKWRRGAERKCEAVGALLLHC